ncbi:phosphatidylglycerol lysyltransferase domain-containing protein [Aquabacterium sp. OR-4]|uniref:phosphatidylglycerol lysyltransferase domain-containing protein n=1 Tax=Aquabacterium sp. OR-4 TaxID=2978127 RepID=UPI0021B1830C|nr:phosphatidylglycerol lysyltransferase domain-containing protein [Aquabacterium sp. OR-4]MDT7838208.1 phosphatidylglycerol lysyltransferase domain-containing protein [Aquabacterium sp. OR-4]
MPAAGIGVPLTLALAPRLAPLLAARLAGLGERAIADLSYANLWLFRRVHDYRFVDGDWPAISGLTYDGQRHLLPLFAPQAAPAEVLRDLMAGHAALFPLTEAEARSLDPLHWTIDAHRDDADYLYPAEHFRHYRGTALQKKRNLMKQCRAAHALQVVAYDAADARHQQAALAVLAGWTADKGKAPGDADDLPCREALSLAAELGLAGHIAWADGEPAGFVLGELLQPGVAVIRFAKGLARFKGISQLLFHHFAVQSPWPVDWMNFEQDLGLENFRRTKLSYQPSSLLPKFRASLRH